MDPTRSYYLLVKNGDLQGLQAAALRGEDLCELKPYGQSLVLHAALEDKIDILEFLIAQGCDVNQGDDEHGLAPLHAAALNNSAAGVKTLLDAGAQVDIRDHYGDTPLFRAVYAYQGDPSVIELLLKHGANPEAKYNSGMSPLELARRKDLTDVVLRLTGR